MFVVMIILVPALAVLLWRSSFGFRVRMSGLSQEAAEANGINTRVVGASALAISGLLAGVAGATQVGTTFWAMPQDFSIQIGFDAIAVALLGANSPIGILPAGLLLGGLLQGSSLMQFSTGVQGPFVEVLEALVILFVVAVPFLLNRLRRHRKQS
jgi:simple sugar transport system permease protein